MKTTGKINKMADSRAELVGFSRLLNNPKIKPEELINQILIPSDFVKDLDVLVINDTTELNYQDHINYLNLDDNELGPTGNNIDLGFFLHPGLVINEQTGVNIGFSYIKIWNRKIGKLDKIERGYNKLPIEEKESYRWIECGIKSKEQLRLAKHITIIADRESDIYEEFVRLPDSKTDLIIRSREDRLLDDGKEKLYTVLGQQTVSGQVTIKLKKDQRKNQASRLAVLDIVSVPVKIRRPNNITNKDIPKYVELYAIEARERNPPAGQQPVCWRLLTTINCCFFEATIKVIHNYCQRWQIEILFATLKTKGLNLEESELERGKALKVLCVLGLYCSLKINQLKQAREDITEISAQIVFTKNEIVVLAALCEKFEGKTVKQKNPYKENTLAWSAWIISRIGGWKGYSSESKPGIKTMRDGLIAFYRIYQGYELLQLKICA